MNQKPRRRTSSSERIIGDIKRKTRLAGDTVGQANINEVTELRRGARDLKELVAEQSPELRLLE